MTFSQALIPYRSSSSVSTPTPPYTSSTTSTSLLPTHLFTHQTGTAIATELLYRLLIDLINRLLNTLHRFASERLDALGSFLERKSIERREARLAAAEAAKEAAANKGSGNGKGLGITEEVGRAAAKRGFVGREVACPLRGEGRKEFGGRGRGKRGPPGPPMWVKGVLEGIEEGRMEERDFVMHSLAD